MTDFREKYKKIGLGLENSSIIRSEKLKEFRQEKRQLNFSRHRILTENTSNMDELGSLAEDSSHEGDTIEAARQSRLERLQKWREEKELRKKIEKEKTKPVFKVGVMHHRAFSPSSTTSPPKHTKMCKLKQDFEVPTKKISRATEKRLATKTGSTLVRSNSVNARSTTTKNISGTKLVRSNSMTSPKKTVLPVTKLKTLNASLQSPKTESVQSSKTPKHYTPTPVFGRAPLDSKHGTGESNKSTASRKTRSPPNNKIETASLNKSSNSLRPHSTPNRKSNIRNKSISHTPQKKTEIDKSRNKSNIQALSSSSQEESSDIDGVGKSIVRKRHIHISKKKAMFDKSKNKSISSELNMSINIEEKISNVSDITNNKSKVEETDEKTSNSVDSSEKSSFFKRNRSMTFEEDLTNFDGLDESSTNKRRSIEIKKDLQDKSLDISTESQDKVNDKKVKMERKSTKNGSHSSSDENDTKLKPKGKVTKIVNELENLSPRRSSRSTAKSDKIFANVSLSVTDKNEKTSSPRNRRHTLNVMKKKTLGDATPEKGHSLSINKGDSKLSKSFHEEILKDKNKLETPRSKNKRLSIHVPKKNISLHEPKSNVSFNDKSHDSPVNESRKKHTNVRKSSKMLNDSVKSNSNQENNKLNLISDKSQEKSNSDTEEPCTITLTLEPGLNDEDVEVDMQSPEKEEELSFYEQRLSITPENLEKPPAFFSPYITASRGKKSIRKEQQTRRGMSLSPEDAIPTKATIMKQLNISVEEEERTAQYFKFLLNKEIERLTDRCEFWNEIQEQSDTTEDAKYTINAAVGQTKLLINKKFERFNRLVQDCETGKGEMLVTCKDLQGFWDMMYMEVKNCDDRFSQLEEDKARGWIEEEEVVVIPVKKVVRKKEPKKLTVEKKSSLRAHILAARKKKFEKNDDFDINIVDTKDKATPLFDVQTSPKLSSIKSKMEKHSTPKSNKRHSLLQMVQMSETSKNTSPLAVMKVSQMYKTPPEVYLDESIVYINSDQTPAKSILKRKKERILSDNRSGRLTFKVNFNEQTSEMEIPNENISAEIHDDIRESCNQETRIERRLNFDDDSYNTSCGENENTLNDVKLLTPVVQLSPLRSLENVRNSYSMNKSETLKPKKESTPKKGSSITEKLKSFGSLLKPWTARKSPKKYSTSDEMSEIVSETEDEHYVTVSDQLQCQSDDENSKPVIKQTRPSRRSVKITSEGVTPVRRSKRLSVFETSTSESVTPRVNEDLTFSSPAVSARRKSHIYLHK